MIFSLGRLRWPLLNILIAGLMKAMNEPSEGKEAGKDLKTPRSLTSGVWVRNGADTNKLSFTERVQLQNSDVISFHKRQTGRL